MLRAQGTLLRTELLALQVWVPEREPGLGKLSPCSPAVSAAGRGGVRVHTRASVLGAVSCELFIRDIWSTMVYSLYTISCLCGLGRLSVIPSLGWGKAVPT